MCHQAYEGKSNVVADALSHRYVLLSTLENKFLGIECINEFYKHDDDFSHIYHMCPRTPSKVYFKHDGYLIKDKRLCILKGSIRRILVKKAYEGGLMGHFGVLKTYDRA